MGVLFDGGSGFFASGLILGFYIVTTAFLFGLFLNDRKKFVSAFIIESVIGTTALVMVSSIYSLAFYICIPIFTGLILMTMMCRGKFVLWITWAVTVIFLALLTIFDLVILIFGILRKSDYFIYDMDVAMSAAVVEMVYPFLILGLVITATVVRVRRKRSGALGGGSDKAGDFASEGKSILRDGRYTASRVEKNGLASAGNVLAAISYVLAVFGVKFAILTGNTGASADLLFIAIIALVVGLILGAIATLMIKTARAYGYESGALKFALYIWAWIMAAIVIAIIVAFAVIMMFFMAMGSDESFSDKVKKANGDVYEVKDENNEKRRLKYSNKEASAYGRCMDDKGDWLETEDGGKTFSKCGLREIEDENGDKILLYDVSGGSLGIFADNKGGMYESKDGGMTVIKLN